MNTILAGYLDERKATFFQDMESEFNTLMKLIGRVKTITPDTQMLEIGPGTGWFQIRCHQRGIDCRGLEIDPDLAASARELARQHGVEPAIDIGSVEASDIGTARYDVIIATSTFEHVKDWRKGLANVAKALKPGGVFYFTSTNKFSLTSGEYWVPLYGWLPDPWRYRLRRTLQGDAIMDWGIDFNQFTHHQLRRYFTRLGFSRVLDRVDFLDADDLNNPTAGKKLLLRTLERYPALKHPVLLFSPDTQFICIK